jgi:hypothetical protein
MARAARAMVMARKMVVASDDNDNHGDGEDSNNYVDCNDNCVKDVDNDYNDSVGNKEDDDNDNGIDGDGDNNDDGGNDDR